MMRKFEFDVSWSYIWLQRFNLLLQLWDHKEVFHTTDFAFKSVTTCAIIACKGSIKSS